jgi:hypothetical protein
MGTLMWKVLDTGAVLGADVISRRLVTRGWKTATGRKPPTNPADPTVSWPRAFGWAVASGACVGVARLLATRRAAEYYTQSAGHLPKALQQPGQ